MKHRWKVLWIEWISVIAITMIHSSESNTLAGYQCSVELNKCTASVNPLLRNISYMFPSSEDEVKRMCGSWSKLVDCVRKYVNNCFDQTRKQYFNAAVENSIGTVHAICSSNSIQREYLLNANCFRKISIDNCRDTYNQLVNFVSTPKSTDDQICCAYSKFRDCVNVPLGNECGAKARNLMHHSLAFLMQKCDSSSDSGRSYENDCVSFPGQRAPKHSAIDHHSHHHHAKHQPASSAGPEAENDYYMNEKHFEGVHDDSESKTKPDNGFQPILPVNMTRTVISRPTAEPEAQNLRKASDSEFPDAAGADTADYDSEPEVASVSSIAHHSTESPQFVRYDSESAGNGIMNIHQNNLISIFLIIWLAFYFPFISSN